MTALLTIQGLTVKFPTRFGEFTAVENLDLNVNTGEIHGLVGESGAGKSTVGAAVIGLLQSPGYIAAGRILLGNDELSEMSDVQLHRLRGRRISMIFQDPQTSLNPLLTIAEQLTETILQHKDISPAVARDQAIAMLVEMGLQDAKARVDDYPHQFSGGMRQRVVIALALCTDPELIIADEPTTALDVSVQKQILALIRSLARDRGVGFILITHDIGVVAEVSDRVSVLRSGRLVESGKTSDVLGNPQQLYTQALMAAVPRLDKRLQRFVNIVDVDKSISGDDEWAIAGADGAYAARWLLSERTASPDKEGMHSTETDDTPILTVANLSITYHSERPGWFGRSKGHVALSDISFELRSGEVLGVVGESGSGKSTLAKAIVGLANLSTGRLHFKGSELPSGSKRSRLHPARRQIQMVFQDPYSSLNNRRTVENILAEPIRFYRLSNNANEIRKLVASVLELVEMPQRAMLKYPHQFSGGQRQRIAIARALVARPEFLICDEPTSALDVSIQAQMLNLLKDLQQTFGLSILFISHNLAVIRQMSDRVLVLNSGKMVETANTDDFFSAPQEPYSQMLLRETPSLALLST